MFSKRGAGILELAAFDSCRYQLLFTFHPLPQLAASLSPLAYRLFFPLAYSGLGALGIRR